MHFFKAPGRRASAALCALAYAWLKVLGFKAYNSLGVIVVKENIFDRSRG